MQYKHVNAYQTGESIPWDGVWLYSEKDADDVDWHWYEIPGELEENDDDRQPGPRVA